MGLTRKKNRSRNRKRLKALILLIGMIGVLVGVASIVKGFVQSSSVTNAEPVTSPAAINQSNSNSNSNSNSKETPETYTNIRIAAAGDIMFHSTQLTSAYDAATKTYDFKSVFEDVKPIISAADLAIANFETTTAGSSDHPYSGYPIFNSPDEVIDAIQYAGFDVLTTANNHSLDTGSKGLKRTVQTIQKKGLDTVGSYDKKPDSRVLMKDIKGIKIAILSYTESTNGLGSQYSADELHAMLNIMEKDRIVDDIREAKELGADLIITFMHWGKEYEENPTDTQMEFARLMATEGADIVLGSHPHVIQKSEYIELEGSKTFVIYSMGNFVSNQRKETLDSRNENTEDGIIVNFDIRKNNRNNVTTIENIEYVPTWVYRNKEAGQSKYTYRILPIELFIDNSDISKAFKQRMKRSLDATVTKMEPAPFVKQ
jgi:poly-gamma-glutamate capsule biosynthesis protein CapA/YwtB (metallophosphatase superfamily)